MGNTPSAEQQEETSAAEEPSPGAIVDESAAASVIQKKWKNRPPTEFKWPENLYVELKDMHDLATFGTYLDLFFKCLRPEDMDDLGLKPPPLPTPPGEEKPAEQPAEQHAEQPSTAATSTPKLTLARLQTFLEEKKDILKENKTFEASHDSMLELLKRIGDGVSSRKVSLVGFDITRVKQKTLYYFIVRDDKLKRLTLILPAENSGYGPDWGKKKDQTKEMATLKRALKARVSGDRVAQVGVHQGFYNFLMTKQTSKQSAPASKYAELVAQMSGIFKAHPKHRLYTTGHGVAGAIAQLLSFFLAFEDTLDIPKPISCINFGSPRVGDGTFWRASQLLEIAAKMRSCRVVMAPPGDSMPCYPSGGGYMHAGYQVMLGGGAEEKSVVPMYPTTMHDGMPRFNLFTSKAEKTAIKTPQEYVDALVANADTLREMDLNKLYVEVGAKSLMFLESSPSQLQIATSSSNEGGGSVSSSQKKE